MNDKAVETILKYLDEYSGPPGLDWPQHWFEEVSFSNWAAAELVNAILDHPFVPAEDTIENFAFQMRIYAITAGDRPASRIFSIAAQMAEEFLDMI